MVIRIEGDTRRGNESGAHGVHTTANAFGVPMTTRLTILLIVLNVLLVGLLQVRVKERPDEEAIQQVTKLVRESQERQGKPAPSMLS